MQTQQYRSRTPLLYLNRKRIYWNNYKNYKTISVYMTIFKQFLPLFNRTQPQFLFIYLHETGEFGKSGQLHFKLHTQKRRKTQEATQYSFIKYMIFYLNRLCGFRPTSVLMFFIFFHNLLNQLLSFLFFP